MEIMTDLNRCSSSYGTLIITKAFFPTFQMLFSRKTAVSVCFLMVVNYVTLLGGAKHEHNFLKNDSCSSERLA